MTIHGTYDILAATFGMSPRTGEGQCQNGSWASTRLRTLLPEWQGRSVHAPWPA
jgi:hypothetical protein